MRIPAMQFTITELELNTFHVEFDNQRDLVHSMMRLQEFYEGVDDTIRGNYFTLEEFMHHFTTEQCEFKYAETWSGFNVPGATVDEWYRVFSSESAGLTEKETQLMKALFQRKQRQGLWYLIATARRKDSATIIKHELAHARYYLNESYRNACMVTIGLIDPFELEYMRKCLIDIGYVTHVVDDEIQAYLSTSKKPELKFWFGKLSPEMLKLVDEFRRCFKRAGHVKIVENANAQR